MFSNKKYLFTLIILSLIIVNIFFYFNSRIYVSTYIVKPINSEQIISSIEGKKFRSIKLL